MAIWGQKGKEVDTIKDVLQARFGIPKTVAETKLLEAQVRAATPSVPVTLPSGETHLFTNRGAIDIWKMMSKDERTNAEKKFDRLVTEGAYRPNQFEKYLAEGGELQDIHPLKIAGQTFRLRTEKAVDYLAKMQRLWFDVSKSKSEAETIVNIRRHMETILSPYVAMGTMIMRPDGTMDMALVNDALSKMRQLAAQGDRDAKLALQQYREANAMAGAKFVHVPVAKDDPLQELLPRMKEGEVLMPRNRKGVSVPLIRENNKLKVIRIQE